MRRPTSEDIQALAEIEGAIGSCLFRCAPGTSISIDTLRNAREAMRAAIEPPPMPDAVRVEVRLIGERRNRRIAGYTIDPEFDLLGVSFVVTEEAIRGVGVESIPPLVANAVERATRECLLDRGGWPRRPPVEPDGPAEPGATG